MSSTNFQITNPNSPLHAGHLSDIKSALQALDAAQAQAELAQRAGIDTSAQMTQIADQRRQLLQIKQVYFPGQ
jgi:hypothetical protein